MKGKVYLVGIGTGDPDYLIPRAVNVLKRVPVIIGQKASLVMVAGFLEGKAVVSDELTPVERAQLAVAWAEAGKDVAIVTMGDPGIYAIASTFFSYLKKTGNNISIEVVPGVAALNAASALLGAPLGHDFAVVSIADMATPWSGIEKRLRAAAEAGFAIVVYNPVGKTGEQRLRKMTAILLKYTGESTPVGIVTSAGRATQLVQLTTLAEVLRCPIDTQSILVVGNAETYVFNDRMVTPRDYKKGVGY